MDAQFCLFDSRNHNTLGMGDQDPGVWPEVAEISRYILSLRYRYLPYLYALFHRVGMIWDFSKLIFIIST